MSKKTIGSKTIYFICSVILGALLALPLNAQEKASSTEQKIVKIKKSVRVPTRVAIDPTAKLRAEIKQCGMACSMSSTDKISSGEGTTRDYDCTDGNCACFGSADCVAMAPICEEGTLGCNDQGCICTEADP